MKKFLLLSCLVFAFIVSNAQWSELPNGTFTTTASPFGFGISDIVFDKLGNVYIAGEFRDAGGNL